MRSYSQNYKVSKNYQKSNGTQLIRSPEDAGGFPQTIKSTGIMLCIIIISNLFTHGIWNPFQFFKQGEHLAASAARPQLYLMDKASLYVTDTDAFEDKVREVADAIDMQPEWLMAVMYSESSFDAARSNGKGSGAAGLIQWMPATAKDFGTSVYKLKKMDHIQQMDYVQKYFERVKKKYGSFNTLTEVYLAILYPRAIPQDYCYTLYADPTEAYKKNEILDEDSDGRVTVSDIDKRMKRLYPKAYIAGQPDYQDV